jgi:hypothetical protein
VLHILLREAGFSPPSGFSLMRTDDTLAVRSPECPDLVIHRRDDQAPHYAQTTYLNIYYKADRDLSEQEREIASSLQAALLRLERSRPETIVGLLQLVESPHHHPAASPAHGSAPGEPYAPGDPDAPGDPGEAPGHSPVDRLVRITLECNQRCPFCNTNLSAPDLARRSDRIEARLEALAQSGADEVCFTGGEPTLCPDLAAHVATAASLGLRVALQTNGVRLEEPDLARSLKKAGLSRVLVSLHSHRKEVSAQLTGASEDLKKTLAGIKLAHDAGITVTTNTVICEPNVSDLPGLVSLLARDRNARAVRGDRADRADSPAAGCVSQMVFSFMAPVARGKRNVDLMARISDVLPSLEAAVEKALEHDITPTIPGTCGAPLCTLGPLARLSSELHAPPTRTIAPDRTHLPSCDRCVYKDRCTGVWREYLRIYGSEELTPITDPV